MGWREGEGWRESGMVDWTSKGRVDLVPFIPTGSCPCVVSHRRRSTSSSFLPSSPVPGVPVVHT